MPSFPFPEDRPLIDCFREIARRYPDLLAVDDGETAWSYRDLAAQVDQVAGAIAAATKDRPGPVAILLASEARYPAAMLGALAAGRAMVPLDAEHPIERNRLIATHSGAQCVVSAGAQAALVRELFPADTATVDLDCLPELPPPRLSPQNPLDTAYIVYTSGSTGTPKGVYRDARGFLNSIAHYTEALQITPADRLTLVYSPSVVAAMRDTFSALLNGASLHMLPPRRLLPAGLVHAVKRRGITVWHSVPTLFRHMVEALGKGERLDSIRVANLSGERVDWRDFDLVRTACGPGAVLSVGLASTECPTYCHWLVDPAVREPASRLPVGRPVAGRRVSIVDEEDRPVPDGAIGELVIASRHISPGYWRNPTLTAERFSPDPDDAETHVFKSGDLGLRRSDGLIEFIGRKDEQIKLRGHRIEPGEIEGALRELNGVRDAAIAVRTADDGSVRSFAAYVELNAGVSGLLPRHLQARLARVLPSYMRPSAIIVVKELPRLPTYKIDRPRLVELDAERANESTASAGDPMIIAVTQVFKRVISSAAASPDDNVASLGGDSLQAVEIMAALQAEFGLEIPAEAFGEMQSIRELAAWIAPRIRKGAWRAKPTIGRAMPTPPATT